MILSVFRRRLKDGVTFEDFLEAWGAEQGFGVPTHVFNAVSVEDPRVVFTIGFVALDAEQLATGLDAVAEQEAVRHSRIDEVVESVERHFYDLRTEHDLTSVPVPVELGSVGSLLRLLREAEPGR